MEIREFAERILTSYSIAAKLRPIEPPVTDDHPGEPFRPALPSRPSPLQFCGRKQSPPMPHPNTYTDPLKRAAVHHILANHELQALEVMAFVLCAFPDAPPAFRREMIPILADEQRHTRLHIHRLEELGLRFGDLSVNGYFWKKAQKFTCLLEYLAGMPLTFEGRNLDHTLEFEQQFEAAGDQTGANVLRIIHRDEIRHVAFGLRWLRELKSPGQSDWEAYESHLHWPLRPEKAKGRQFHREPRSAAGLSDDFLDHLERS
jgi:uncharacterized ferritin-like protein (DUF455 family)